MAVIAGHTLSLLLLRVLCTLAQAVYVGNFGWWTTDQKLLDLCVQVGVNDVKRINIFVETKDGVSKWWVLRSRLQIPWSDIGANAQI